MAISVFVPQAQAVANRTLIPSAAYSASDTTSSFPVDFFSTAGVTVVTSLVSGASAALNVYVQKLLPDNSTWMDVASFPQFTAAVYTTTGTYELAFINAGNAINQQKDGALTANTVLVTDFGSSWRVKFTLSGSATFGVFANFTG